MNDFICWGVRWLHLLLLAISLTGCSSAAEKLWQVQPVFHDARQLLCQDLWALSLKSL